ncbi:hypothetical protein EDB85DRAFT_1871170, partial [Lactarius pseudohatsudake]
DGSMAIFCPACPQPGINLPDDWKIKYHDQPYAFIDPINISLLIFSKESAYPNIHNGWQLLSGAHEVQNWGNRCSSIVCIII